MNSAPISQDIVLVGGGHSHVILIRKWGMRPIPGVRLTLVSSAVQTPYSGMLPGLIAGHYSFDDIHIDLLSLCTWAGVRFVEHTVSGLDLEQKLVCFATRPPVGFDLLSIDTGSTPDLSVSGFNQRITPVKPVSNFYQRWQSLIKRIEQDDEEQVSIGVVGSGAGGFELVSAMRYALPVKKATCHWFLRGEMPLTDRPDSVGKLALAAADRYDIEVVKQFDVTNIDNNTLYAKDGRSKKLDEILWCTAAAAPQWPEASGLAVDEKGCVATNGELQSISHDFVFACGDIGTQINSPSPKAGVFAVRQAPVIYTNLVAKVLGKPLQSYRPQKDFLSLMAVGPKRAIASRGRLALEADWIWRWKDWIDRRFMQQFKQLPDMNENRRSRAFRNALTLPPTLPGSGQGEQEIAFQARCRGCGAKVGDTVLSECLVGYAENERLKLLNTSTTELSPAGDAAVFNSNARNWVQSVDQINAIVDEPYLLGRIAAVHALSDVVTMPTTLHSAQVIVTLPEASDAVLARDLRALMSGVVEVLNEEDCAVIGGHTTQGQELSVGLVVNATADSLQTRQPNSGDALVLTKGLGTGVLFAGLMQQVSSGASISESTDSMIQSNRLASTILFDHGATAMTDVTGFGLLGHLEQLMTGVAHGATLYAAQIPYLSGALDAAESGVRSSLWPQNSRILERLELDPEIGSSHLSLLCDPQTSGGLLAILPAENAELCVEKLRQAGYRQAALVGDLQKSQGLRVRCGSSAVGL
ncbi:MAG: selenide, water dikinase SelD [Granulosicoccus sp.]|nr:selenide, water dikinase SelD [Granulosicoccus sp.]